MGSLQLQLARLMGRREGLTSAECDAKLREIGERLEAIDARSLEIDYNSGGRPGPALRKALEEGEPRDVLKLQDESRLLDAERDSLLAQREAIQERREAAIAEEALPVARQALKKIPALAAQAEKAAAALAQARAALEAELDALTQARHTALGGGQKPPKMDEALFDRLHAFFRWNEIALDTRRRTLLDRLHPNIEAANAREAERREQAEKQRKAFVLSERARLEARAERQAG